MKIDSLIALLDTHAVALTAAGAGHAAADLAQFARALEPMRAATSVALASRLQSLKPHQTDQPRRAATAGSVAALVTDLGKVVAAAGAKPAAKDIEILSTGLRALGELRIEEVAAGLSAAEVKAPKRRQTSEPALVDLATAKQIADRLTAVNLVDQKFKAALADLKAMKMSKAMIEAIANAFLGHPTTWKYKSITEAWKKIEERHFLDNLSESRARTINSINV